MSTELAIPSELSSQPPAFLEWARSLVIADAEGMADAGERLKQIKGFSKRVADWFKPMKQAQDEAKRRILEAEHSLLDPSAEAERLAKDAMIGYQREEQAKAEKERRRLQAIADEKARVERQAIEAQAARQRAIEAEARAKAEAARQAEEKARREAEAASAAQRKKLLAAAEAARLESEAADRKAASAAAKAEVKEDAAIVVVAPVVAVATSAPKVAGISTRKTWTAEVVDQAAFIAWACEAKRYDLLLPNNEVLKALAKGLREAASMPGVKFSQTETMSAKGT